MRRRLLLTLLCVSLPQAVYAQFPSSNVTLPAFVIPASAVNGGGTVTSAQLLAPDGSASAPSYSFTNETNTGWYRGATNRVSLSLGGTEWYRFDQGTLLIGGTEATLSYNGDVLTRREAAGHLFQRNSTNAQRASWANTYTSSTNYEAFSVDWQTQANVALVGTRTAATGTGRKFRLGAQADNASNAYSSLLLTTDSIPYHRMGITAADGTLSSTSGTGNMTELGYLLNAATSGSVAIVAITPTYNQSSGTAANTDLLINRTQTAVGSGAQYSIQAQIGGTNTFAATAGTTGKGTQLSAAQTTVPTCSSNCGTSPSVVGSDTAMRVTMGSSGVPTSGFVITFNGTWPVRPVCQVSMGLAGMVVGKTPLTTVTTTTTLTVVTNGTAPSTSDVYDVICFGIQ